MAPGPAAELGPAAGRGGRAPPAGPARPPVASKDVYAYSFYGKVQTEYGANPYLSFPDQHPTDPWHKFWSWRLFGPVYGPPFLLLLRLLAMVAGPSLLTWVVLTKLVLVAAELAAIWLLVRPCGPRRGSVRTRAGRCC